MTTTMMATTTAAAPPLSPTHGAGSSGRGGSNTTTTDEPAESSTSHQRRKSGGSSGSAGGSSRRNNPMNPAFGMTSNSAGPSRSPPAAPSSSHSSSAAAGSTTSSSRVKRNQKSSDRLHRLGAASGSSTHLAGKRNKSHTQLAGAGVARKRGSSKGQRRAEGGSGGGGGVGETEDGWTSATPEGTRPSSPTEEANMSDEEDEGLTMGGRKKPAAGPAPAAPPTTTVKEPTPPPPTFSRSDTAATLVAAEDATPTGRDEGGPLAFPRRQDDDAITASSSAHRSRSDSDGTLGDNSRATSAAPSSSSATTAADRDTSAPSSSKSTPLKGVPGPGRTQPHLRISSSASNKTLTGSPASTMSRMSTRSRTLSLMPRGGDRHAAAPPMLSTHNALAGNLGAQQERRSNDFMTVPSRSFSSGMTPSPSAPAYLHEGGGYDEGRPLRRQGSQASISSNITLPGGSATVGRASRSTASRGPIPSEAEFEERRRTESTRSLTAADAAKLAAKLRQARDAMDERSGIVSSSSSRGGASASLANAALDGGVGGLGGGARYSKPVVSMFAKEQERRNKPHAVPVTSTSVWSPHFTAAVASSTDEARDKAKHRASQQPRCIRYAGLYGLGGPPIEKTPLNDALLAPSFDGDEFEASWAPALANAAGLGARSTRAGGGGGASSDMMQDGTPFHDPTLPLSGSAAVNGPNATPVHLIHGLTAISPEPFPLDPADAPSLHLGGGGNDVASSGDSTASLMADPATLRAIALTSQVLSTHRSHEMTRRYYDPMREGLDRALRPSARAALAAAAAAAGGGVGGTTPGATSTTGGANSARRSATAPSSPRSNSGTGGRLGSGQSSRSGPGGGGRHHQQSQSHLHLSSLGEAAAAAANSPVQSLKRVWSSAGASRVTGEARR